MVRYFEELENPSSQSIILTSERPSIVRQVNEHIPEEYVDVIAKIFKIIKSYDLLYDMNLPETPYFTEGDCDFSYYYGSYIESHDLGQSGVTPYGVGMIDRLYNKYKEGYKGVNIYEDFRPYFLEIANYISNSLLRNKTELLECLKSAKAIARYQGKLKSEDEKQIDEAIKYLNSTDRIVKQSEYITRELLLPNAWYITPYNQLYNTTGKEGHSQSNLKYPYSEIINYGNIKDPREFIKRIEEILESKTVNWFDHFYYLHFANDFISFASNDAFLENRNSSDSKMIKLIIGVLSAHVGLYCFFNYLKKNSSDYEADLDFLKTKSLDEVLIRCCGFHKALSIPHEIFPKTIVTSDLNYIENFQEYITKGWRIDFVKPITLDYNGRLNEVEDDFIKILDLKKKV